MTYKEVPVIMGPALGEEEIGSRGMAGEELGHATKTGPPPKKQEAVDGL